MKIKYINGDPNEEVTLLHKESDGMCEVQTTDPADRRKYRVHKSMLHTPEHLKSKRHTIHVDPLEQMRRKAH